MAIFTDDANYLKCIYYFFSVLGFKKYDTNGLLDNITRGDNLNIINGKGETVVIDNQNIAIARNIWFAFSKAKAWSGEDFDGNEVDEENPPLPISSTPSEYLDKELWNQYPTAFNKYSLLTSQKANAGLNGFNLFVKQKTTTKESDSKDAAEFFGLKRLLSLNDEKHTSECIYLAKYNGTGDINNYESYIKCDTLSSIIANKPNSIIFQISYEKGDFGTRESDNKEYTLRQLGMVNCLRVKENYLDFVSEQDTLYNGMNKSESEPNVLLSEILDFDSEKHESLDYLSLRSIPEIDDKVTTKKADNTHPWSILHFYENMTPNYRFTYQKDKYIFILTFENKKRCECDCDICNSN